ncbi:MAG: substrate-binding domain-containing protein [Maricaulaceae bacterium]
MKLNSLLLSASCIIALVACGGSGEQPSASAKDPSAKAKKADKRQDIRIVGSSTVYPFSTKVAQEFKNKTGYNVVVEATGSGGGHKLFCDGPEAGTPDVTNSSRRQKTSEFNKCADNGVNDIIEVKIGFDGIVVANAIDAAPMSLELKDIYRAFAKEIPVSDTDCTLQANPFTKWSDVNPSLADFTIEAYGPPPTSGTRDAFVEIAMEGGAKSISCLKALSGSDKKAFKAISHTMREDGKWIDAGENDNALVQTLVNTPTAVGVFGFSFLDQNTDKIKGAVVAGSEPVFENIATGDYPVSRSLFFYIKKAHIGQTPGLKEYALEFTSESASGPGGYLEEIGLVPLSDSERAKYRADIETLTAYSQ